MEERILQFLTPWLAQYGYWTLLLVTFLETSAFLGLVAPGETIIVLCGFYAFRGVLDPWVVGAIAALGGLAGDQVGYLIGRRFGRGVLERFGRYFFFDERRLRATESYYERHGGKTVFFGRFLSILRSFGPLVAGSSRMSYPRFFAMSAASCALWGAGYTLLGYFFGKSWDLIDRYLGWGGLAAFVAGVALFVWWLHRRSHRDARPEPSVETADEAVT